MPYGTKPYGYGHGVRNLCQVGGLRASWTLKSGSLGRRFGMASGAKRLPPSGKKTHCPTSDKKRGRCARARTLGGRPQGVRAGRRGQAQGHGVFSERAPEMAEQATAGIEPCFEYGPWGTLQRGELRGT